MPRAYYSGSEIAAIMGMAPRSIRLRAMKHNWPTRKRKGRGGGRVYKYSALCADIQTKILEQEKKTAPYKDADPLCKSRKIIVAHALSVMAEHGRRRT